MANQPSDNGTAGPRYHHGSLKTALLEAAEAILKRDGIEGLTLRAAAREVGVSHAAPKNHFDDVRGLLSELAAVGFNRFRETLSAEVIAQRGTLSPLDAIGIGYVKFARQNPQMFTLMFRSERLDFERPALKSANQAAFALLAGAAASSGDGAAGPAMLTIDQTAHIAAKWSLVHGFACLMLDGRLDPLLRMTEEGVDAVTLITTIIRGAPPVAGLTDSPVDRPGARPSAMPPPP